MYSPDTLKRLNAAEVRKAMAKRKESCCDFCDQPATILEPVYNPADGVRDVKGAYAMLAICQDCWDKGTHFEDLYYCEGCSKLFAQHHSWDKLVVELDGQLLCHKCAAERLDSIPLIEVVEDLRNARTKNWVRINNIPWRKLLWGGEYSQYDDFPGHTSLDTIADEILEAAEAEGLPMDTPAYPLVTHTYQFSVALGVFI